MSQVSELEQQKKDYTELLEKRKMALRLSNNRDFKKLILEEFCVAECARYAQNSANPQFSAEERADCLAISQAAGHLRRYLSVVTQMGAHAERDMANLELALDEARNEEVSGNQVDMFSDNDSSSYEDDLDQED